MGEDAAAARAYEGLRYLDVIEERLVLGPYPHGVRHASAPRSPQEQCCRMVERHHIAQVPAGALPLGDQFPLEGLEMGLQRPQVPYAREAHPRPAVFIVIDVD